MTLYATRGLRVALLATVVVLAGCDRVPAPPAAADTPVQLSPVPGSGRKSVALSEESSVRIGLTTTTVTAAPAGAPAGQVQVPYAAIVYDEQGGSWVFAPTAPRTYARVQVTIDHVAGAVAVLSAGPPLGSPVVTIGAQELLGAEQNVSGEG